jgi:hypothetical protein
VALGMSPINSPDTRFPATILVVKELIVPGYLLGLNFYVCSVCSGHSLSDTANISLGMRATSVVKKNASRASLIVRS